MLSIALFQSLVPSTVGTQYVLWVWYVLLLLQVSSLGGSLRATTDRAGVREDAMLSHFSPLSRVCVCVCVDAKVAHAQTGNSHG